jgi:hypothetical protein
MQCPDGFVIDDELAYVPLRRLGWEVEAVPWRQRGVDWSRFDAVIIRSTWDYQKAPGEFFSVLEHIQRSGARLENNLDLVRWNMTKTYLRDLQRHGVAVVPTLWGPDLGPVNQEVIVERLQTDEVVLKPLVGANADHTFRLSRGADAWSEAAVVFARQPYLAQPFIRNVVDEGEYSLIFFNGRLSHTILKTPRAGDFRVQEEHGGIIRAATPTAELRSAGEQVIAALEQASLYARADFVRLDRDQFALMELELVEPALYLRMDSGAPERFARALDERLGAGHVCFGE